MIARTLSVSALAFSVTIAQSQGPQRDLSLIPTFGNASVSGVVVTDEEIPQPVRRAIVALTGDGLRPSRGAVTDDDGRFVIKELPAGRFMLTASRASYVTSAYGAKRPGRAGTPIVVANGANLTGLSIKLWRGAVITGTVRDVNGAPVPGIPVTAIPSKPPGSGQLATLTNNGAQTNEAGEYRIYGLEPGAYLVSAEPVTGYLQMVELRDAEIDAMLEALRRRSATPSAPSPAMPATRPFDFAPVFYPGTVSAAQASPVTLTPGEELGGLDLTLQREQRSTITGKVLRPDGTPAAGASVQLAAEPAPGPFLTTPLSPLMASTSHDGSFRIAQVSPGSYELIVRAAVSSTFQPSTPGFVNPGPTGPQLWASSSLVVGREDVDGLNLTVAPGLTITGRVVFKSDTLKPPVNPTLRVTAMPVSVLSQKPGSAIQTIAFTPGASVRSDGTFELVNQAPGVFRLLVSGATLSSGDWMLESARMGDRDLLDGNFEIRGGGSATLTLTLTDKSSELSGLLQTASGAPASDVFVIAYSANRVHWGPGMRRVRAVRPGVDGRYSIRDLPAGEYLLAAVLDIDENDWNVPGFLEQLVPASIKIMIGEGEKKTQDLRIGK